MHEQQCTGILPKQILFCCIKWVPVGFTAAAVGPLTLHAARRYLSAMLMHAKGLVSFDTAYVCSEFGVSKQQAAASSRQRQLTNLQSHAVHHSSSPRYPPPHPFAAIYQYQQPSGDGCAQHPCQVAQRCSCIINSASWSCCNHQSYTQLPSHAL